MMCDGLTWQYFHRFAVKCGFVSWKLKVFVIKLQCVLSPTFLRLSLFPVSSFRKDVPRSLSRHFSNVLPKEDTFEPKNTYLFLVKVSTLLWFC